jgi:hypothetical protein
MKISKILLLVFIFATQANATNTVKTSTWLNGKYGMFQIGNEIFYTYDKAFIIDFNKKDFMLKHFENYICNDKDLRTAINAKIKFHYIYVHQGKSMIITIDSCNLSKYK